MNRNENPSNQNNQDKPVNQNNNAPRRNPGQDIPGQIRQNPGNAVAPPSQNRPVRQQQNRPAPPNFTPGANSRNQPVRKTVRNANMSDEMQKGHTRVFDTRTDIDAVGKNGGETYHYTGRDIKSSRQKFADAGRSQAANSAGARKRISYDDEREMRVSKNREKSKNREDDIDSKRDGFIMSGIIKVILYIAGVFLVSGILAYNIIMVANDVFAFVKTPVGADVSIPENADIDKIAQILYDNKLIKYPKIFNFYSNYRKKDNTWEFAAGTYTVSSDMNYDEFISAFRKRAAERQIIRITIPEGFTIDEIIDLFIKNGIGSRDKFTEVINGIDFSSYDYRFLKPLYEEGFSPDRKYKLEGYLFPDTYDFYKDESELSIVLKFLDNFNVQFTEDCYKKCEILNMTIDEIVNLASIIEREAKFKDDFPKISAVFHNRLTHSASFPYLESDATIQYSYSQRKADLTAADLQQDLPYNTYTRKGLPPSAICNPGYEAIFSALWPEENSPYYFFVANTVTGEVYYGATNAEHESNKIKAKAAS